VQRRACTYGSGRRWNRLGRFGRWTAAIVALWPIVGCHPASAEDTQFLEWSHAMIDAAVTGPHTKSSQWWMAGIYEWPATCLCGQRQARRSQRRRQRYVNNNFAPHLHGCWQWEHGIPDGTWITAVHIKKTCRLQLFSGDTYAPYTVDQQSRNQQNNVLECRIILCGL
jgi:hypothetical protein